MQVKIGIIGAGVMGRGVAQRFAQNGYSVLLLDKSADILTKAKDELTRQLKMASMFNKTISVDDVMGRISFICDYSELNDADFIIENVNENEEIKKDVYTELEKVCKNECIYMVNTSLGFIL